MIDPCRVGQSSPWPVNDSLGVHGGARSHVTTSGLHKHPQRENFEEVRGETRPPDMA